MCIINSSPAAYHTVQFLGILTLHCEAGILMHQESIWKHSCEREEEYMYEKYKEKRENNGFVRPVGKGILIWNEVKVMKHVPICNVLVRVMIYTCAIKANTEQQQLVYYRMSSDEFISLHDVYPLKMKKFTCSSFLGGI